MDSYVSKYCKLSEFCSQQAIIVFPAIVQQFMKCECFSDCNCFSNLADFVGMVQTIFNGGYTPLNQAIVFIKPNSEVSIPLYFFLYVEVL